MQKLKARLDIKSLAYVSNIATQLDKEDLDLIGHTCKLGYDLDCKSREQWEVAYAKAYELALQVAVQKTFPWPGASNIKFPLLTIAALNWHAKAYPAIVNPTQVVKARVLAPANDPEGARYAASCRVSEHMSYQLLEESDWEEETDRELIALPIVGTMFRKSYYSTSLGQNVSDLVFPKDLVVDYFTKSLETASRISHVLQFTQNDIKERENEGTWVVQDYHSPILMVSQDAIDQAVDKAHGINEPMQRDESVPYEFVEQACLIDLDGDGYAEPYYVLFEAQTGRIARIFARFVPSGVKTKGDKVIRITAQCCYTKIPFIPSPDGSFYDLGLGLLLGPLNHSVDSLINMLVDAGTMSNTGGGFLGRGVKIKGGNYRFAPQEWKRVESTGEDLGKSIFPLPVREPSAILFNLLTYLVGYAERIAGSTDVQVGAIPGDNAKTGVLEIANENGRAIFSATFKRVWRGHKREFDKLYSLNATYFSQINQSYRGAASGVWLQIKREDYEFAQSGILPAADPLAVSKTERLGRAKIVMANALNIPGHNVYQATKRVYEEMGVEGIEQIFPDPKGDNAIPPTPDVRLLEVQVKQMQAETQRMQVIQAAQSAFGKLQQEEQLVRAKVIQLLADAELKMAQSDSVNKQDIIANIHSQIEAEKVKLSYISKMMDTVKELANSGNSTTPQGVTGSTGKGTSGSTGDRVPTLADRPGNSGLPQLPTTGTPSPQERVG